MSDKFFRHDYLVANEYRADAITLCVRCAAPIRSEKARQMKKPNSSEMMWVVDLVRHSNYRLVPIAYVKDDKKRLTHIPVCADCIEFQLTPEIAELIKNQIMRAELNSAHWCGYPEELKRSIRERWAKSQVVERLSGKTLEEAYNFKMPEEAKP